VIAECPGVDDVYVYGMPFRIIRCPGRIGRGRRRWCRNTGTRSDPQSIFAPLCRKKLEPNFVPSYIQVLDQIPKTASKSPRTAF